MLAGDNSLAQQQWTSYALDCVKDALLYFQNKFGDDSLYAFKAARYFMPSKVNEMQPAASDLDSLTAILFLDSTSIASLKQELWVYFSKSSDVSPNTGMVEIK